MPRSGRRPGRTRTRTEILAAARLLFAERGYAGTSVRAVADAAQVNAALVHHYFGTKSALFVAALHLPLDPPQLLAELLSGGPRAEFPERVVRRFVRMCRDPDTGPALRAMLRHAVGTDDGARGIRELLENVLLPRASAALGVPPIRFAAAMSQLIGLVIVSAVVGVRPLADADEDELVSLVAPTIARYLEL